MANIYIGIKENKATICNFKKMSPGVRPRLPKYNFIGPYDTVKQAEKSLPIGVEFKGEIVGQEK